MKLVRTRMKRKVDICYQKKVISNGKAQSCEASDFLWSLWSLDGYST